MTPKIVAYRLKKLRKLYGYTQRGAARLLGVTPTQLMQWETGKRMPHGKSLYKLGALYKVLNEDLYYELRQEAVAEIAANRKKYGDLGMENIKGKPP